MGKLIKWMFRAIALLLLAGILLVLAIGLFFDANDFKHHVSDFVLQETGYLLNIDGPVKLQWFPSAAVQLSEVQFSLNQDADDQPLFSATGLLLKLDWKALLGRRIRIEALTLDQPSVSLLRDQKGQGNWEPLLHSLSTGKPQAAENKHPDADFGLFIHRIQLQDASVYWHDQQSGKEFSLQHLQLSTGYLQPGKPALIRAQLGLSLAQAVMKLQLSLSGELDVDDSFNLIDLSAMAMELTVQGEELPHPGLRFELAADLSLNIPDEHFQLDDLSIAGVHTHITGHLHGKGFSGLPQLDGRLVMQETNLRSLLMLSGIAVDTADPQALTGVSAEIGLQQQGELLLIRPIVIHLDESVMQGEGQLRAWDSLQLAAELKMNRIDLDRYLPPRQAKDGTGFRLSTNIQSLRKLQLDAKVSVGELRSNKVTLHDVLMKVRSTDTGIGLSF